MVAHIPFSVRLFHLGVMRVTHEKILVTGSFLASVEVGGIRGEELVLMLTASIVIASEFEEKWVLTREKMRYFAVAMGWMDG